MPTNLNLVNSDVVLFESGPFTGSVNAGGATICVAAPATMRPPYVGPTGTLPATRGSLAAAIAVTFGGFALTLVGRTRRQ